MNTEHVEAAEREANAAIAIADDPLGPRALARDHVLAGWKLLAEARGEELDLAKLPFADAPTIARLEALKHDDDPLRPATDLVRAIERARRELGLPRKSVHWRRIAIVGAVTIALLVLAVIAKQDRGEDGPWHASYFANPDLEGPAIERREGDVRFYWHVRPPIDEIPADGFSARFTTCLVLDEPVPEAAFQIASDDAARVLVDDAIVVDDWTAHRYRSRGAILPLAAGTHRLVVEFFDREREATLVLVASLDGDVPKEIPVRRLRLPDPQGNCP